MQSNCPNKHRFAYKVFNIDKRKGKTRSVIAMKSCSYPNRQQVNHLDTQMGFQELHNLHLITKYFYFSF